MEKHQEYAVEVLEVFPKKRTYFVDAPNAKEAKRNAEDWHDAEDGWEHHDELIYGDNDQMDRIVVKKVRRCN